MQLKGQFYGHKNKKRKKRTKFNATFSVLFVGFQFLSVTHHVHDDEHDVDVVGGVAMAMAPIIMSSMMITRVYCIS